MSPLLTKCFALSRKSTLIFHCTQVQNVVKQTISKHISEAETIQWRQRQRVQNSKHCNGFVWSIHSGRKMNRQYNIQMPIGVLKDSPKRSKEMVWSKDLHYYHLHLHLKQNQLHSHLKWGHHCQTRWNSILLLECLVQNGRQRALEGRQYLVFVESHWHQKGVIIQFCNSDIFFCLSQFFFANKCGV